MSPVVSTPPADRLDRHRHEAGYAALVLERPVEALGSLADLAG